MGGRPRDLLDLHTNVGILALEVPHELLYDFALTTHGPEPERRAGVVASIPATRSRGDGEQSRDFCYVDNACQANWLAIQADPKVCNGQAINIACNRRTSLNEILVILRRLLGTDIEADYQAPRPGDVKHSLASVDLARETIGYEPAVFFEQGLVTAIDWYKDHLG